MSLENSIEKQTRFNDKNFTYKGLFLGLEEPPEHIGFIPNLTYDLGTLTRLPVNKAISLYESSMNYFTKR